MYGFLSKLLITKKISFEEGRITLFNEPYIIIAIDSLKAMTDDAVAKGTLGISELYYYGWVYGFIGVLKAVNMFKLKKFEERYKLSMDIASLVGFGDYKTLEYKRGEYANFLSIKNPFALSYYPNDKVIDHYLRGINAGGGTIGHETLMQCIELECGAVSNGNCRFINASMGTLSKMEKGLVDSQLDLKFLVKKQKTFVESLNINPSDFGFDN